MWSLTLRRAEGTGSQLTLSNPHPALSVRSPQWRDRLPRGRSMKLTRRRAAAGATMTALSIAWLGACGSGDDDPASSDVASLDDGGSPSDSTPEDTATDGSGSPEDRGEAMLEFAQCMRDHGVEMEDPQFDSEGGGIVLESTPENEDEVEAAQEACQPVLDAMGEIEVDPEEVAEMREQALEWAQCMRDYGVEVPDPQFEDDGRYIIQEEGPDGNFRQDPDFLAAQEACQAEDPGMPTNSDAENEDG
jgi:hypothetical protein